MDAICNEYKAEIKSAYDAYYGFKNFKEDNFYINKKQLGQLGARISAATKRAKRQLIIIELFNLKEQENVDLTYHCVQNLVKRVLKNRKYGFDCKVVLEIFATEGRTAANKTCVDEDFLKQTELELNKKMKLLMSRLRQIKDSVKNDFDNAGSVT